jgi:hypothetical protein
MPLLLVERLAPGPRAVILQLHLAFLIVLTEHPQKHEPISLEPVGRISYQPKAFSTTTLIIIAHQSLFPPVVR